MFARIRLSLQIVVLLFIKPFAKNYVSAKNKIYPIFPFVSVGLKYEHASHTITCKTSIHLLP
jgi:hypothetical protein